MIEKTMLWATAMELELTCITYLSSSRRCAAEARARLTQLLAKLDDAEAKRVRAALEHLAKADELYDSLLNELREVIRELTLTG